MNTMPTPVSQELLDVVDANDRVTGVRTRGEVHSLGLMHRSVHILIFNSKGEMFIQKRSMTKDNNPGLWDSSAADHLDCGEDYLDCATRELAEELGVVTTEPLDCDIEVK
jgi:isopentenyldiphosphate isomerase